MKLDPEIVRQLLLDIEDKHDAPDWEMTISSQDYTRYYAAKKLLEAGYLFCRIDVDTEDDDIDYLVISEMSFAGHAFLDTVRDPKIWADVKAGGKSIGAAGIEALAALAKGFVKKKIEEHTGVKV